MELNWPLPVATGLSCVMTTGIRPRANTIHLAAYWIAFGPHGPRALPPPDEGKKVALGVAVGVFASLVIFGGTRLFAKPAPHTMNKEWQEAANEYLKVRQTAHFARPTSADAQNRNKKRTPSPVSPLPTTRARVRSSPLPRRLKQHRSGGSGGKLMTLSPLSVEQSESFPHGLNPMCKMISRQSIGRARGLDGMGISRVDVNMWCMRNLKALPN